MDTSRDERETMSQAWQAALSAASAQATGELRALASLIPKEGAAGEGLAERISEVASEVSYLRAYEGDEELAGDVREAVREYMQGASEADLAGMARSLAASHVRADRDLVEDDFGERAAQGVPDAAWEASQLSGLYSRAELAAEAVASQLRGASLEQTVECDVDVDLRGLSPIVVAATPFGHTEGEVEYVDGYDLTCAYAERDGDGRTVAFGPTGRGTGSFGELDEESHADANGYAFQVGPDAGEVASGLAAAARAALATAWRDGVVEPPREESPEAAQVLGQALRAAGIGR